MIAIGSRIRDGYELGSDDGLVTVFQFPGGSSRLYRRQVARVLAARPAWLEAREEAAAWAAPVLSDGYEIVAPKQVTAGTDSPNESPRSPLRPTENVMTEVAAPLSVPSTEAVLAAMVHLNPHLMIEAEQDALMLPHDQRLLRLAFAAGMVSAGAEIRL